MVARAIPPSKKAPDYFRKRSGPFAVVDPTVCLRRFRTDRSNVADFRFDIDQI